MLLTKNEQPIQEHLRYSFGGGVALTLVILLSYLCINLTGKIAEMFFSAAMLDFDITKEFTLSYLLGVTVTLILSIILLSPLRLNIKSWYQYTGDADLPVTMAFAYFASMKKYLTAVNFCVIRFIVVFATYLLPLTPSILLAGILRYALGRTGFTFASPVGALFILTIILFILGLIFAIYFSVGYFFADFIYVKKIERNPFKALAMSRRIARNNRSSLYLTIAKTLPYYLLCIFIVTIPFLIPRIRITLAVYADEILY